MCTEYEKNQGKIPGPYFFQSHWIFYNDVHESTFQIRIGVRQAIPGTLGHSDNGGKLLMCRVFFLNFHSHGTIVNDAHGYKHF